MVYWNKTLFVDKIYFKIQEQNTKFARNSQNYRHTHTIDFHTWGVGSLAPVDDAGTAFEQRTWNILDPEFAGHMQR